ncbi:hypothetical protein D9613_009554 [Agrocybe pediades]|uniref:Uncharacterized protein n=1 Tax=Agrocybe pediades TaxID=84607 RepID=A0A8H4VTQ5_9AGAR|nr:hypothetical protein D9613_009554 [Agrocybe pediades]
MEKDSSNEDIPSNSQESMTPRVAFAGSSPGYYNYHTQVQRPGPAYQPDVQYYAPHPPRYYYRDSQYYPSQLPEIDYSRSNDGDDSCSCWPCAAWLPHSLLLLCMFLIDTQPQLKNDHQNEDCR